MSIDKSSITMLTPKCKCKSTLCHCHDKQMIKIFTNHSKSTNYKGKVNDKEMVK